MYVKGFLFMRFCVCVCGQSLGKFRNGTTNQTTQCHLIGNSTRNSFEQNYYFVSFNDKINQSSMIVRNECTNHSFQQMIPPNSWAVVITCSLVSVVVALKLKVLPHSGHVYITKEKNPLIIYYIYVCVCVSVSEC